MPHENINSSLDGCGRLQVTWKPAGNVDHAYGEPELGYVQVMSEDPESPARLPGEICEEGSSVYEPGEPFTGYATTLSREDINRAIRMLRRARDSAYGPDA